MATKSIHITGDDDDPIPMLHWLLAIAISAAMWAGIIMLVIALITPAQAADYRLVQFNGAKWYTPTKAMTVKIERMIATGKAPGFARLGYSDIRKRCPGISPKATGCTVRMGRTPMMIYLRSGQSAAAEHFALVHETAHWLGWDHPDRYPADPRLPVDAHL